MITKIILTLFALVFVLTTLVFFVHRIQDFNKKDIVVPTYITETIPEKEEVHCDDYTSVYESEKLKEYYTCYKEGDFGYKLNFLRHVLTITEYENTLAKNRLSFTQKQAYGLVQIMLNEISVSNFEMYDETNDLLKKIESEFFIGPVRRNKLSYYLFSLFGYQDFDYEFKSYGKGFINIYYCLSGTGAGVRNDIVKLAENGVIDVDEYQLVNELIGQMQMIYGSEVYSEGRDGISVQNKKHPFEIKVYLHRDNNSAACCPDLFVKCKTKDFTSVIKGSIKHCYVPEDVQVPDDQLDWQSL
jgi:hypothetical protein